MDINPTRDRNPSDVLQFEPERYGKNVKRARRMTKVLKPGGTHWKSASHLG